MAEQSDTYFDTKIDAENCDGGAGDVEVTVSVGEFKGLVLGVHGLSYENVELTVEGATRLRDAIDAAMPVLIRAEATGAPGDE